MRISTFGLKGLTLTALALLLLLVPQMSIAAEYQTAMGSGLFELEPGDGKADIVGSTDLAGPDWEDLFTAEKLWRDSTGDGTPDYISLYNGQAAVFVTDDIVAVSGLETSALTQDGNGVQYAVVDPKHDIGNVYLYTTNDQWGNLVIYGATERVGWGDTQYEFELNQDHFRLGRGGYRVGKPWSINGVRTPGDVMIRLTFAKNIVAEVEVLQWDGENFASLAFFYGESCNEAQTACAASNAWNIYSGPWANMEPEILANRFAEFGVNLGAMTELTPQFTTLCIRTPQDIAFGYFAEGN